jgi:hypothetical protein
MLWTAPTLRHQNAIGCLRRNEPLDGSEVSTIGFDQNWARRLGNACAHLNRFSLCERAFGQATVVAFPPQLLHLRSPDLPVPKHSAHQDTRSFEPHFGHRLPSPGKLLIAVHSSSSPEASLKVCEAPHITGSLSLVANVTAPAQEPVLPPSRRDRDCTGEAYRPSSRKASVSIKGWLG